MIVLGLTGGTGSGKSTVSKILNSMGAKILDADLIARQVVQKGEKALEEIVEYFGTDILLESGELDRKKLGRIVFADQEQLKVLNKITHKYIINEIKKNIDYEIEHKLHDIVVIDAALLIESDLYRLCDAIWVVVSEKEYRIERIMKRDGISREDAENRIASQMPQEMLLKYASEIIDNNDDYLALFAHVKEKWEKLKNNIK